ncbi:MAG: GNAT family N-acetyltransferase [Nitrolancea sp.]
MSAPEPQPRFTFRPLQRDDMPLMHRWLYVPHVAEWWWTDQEPTAEDLEEKYLPRIHGEDPTDCYVIVEDGRDIGYIQSYVIANHPEYAELVDVEERAAGIDLFIGEPDRVHRGLGPPLLRQFLRDVVFANYDVESCIIGPSVKNTSAIHAYEKAGFSYFKTINVPDEDDPEYLLRIWREELLGDE